MVHLRQMVFRVALRALLKSPGFLLTSVVTIALGIASTAAVFSVMDAVLLNPLPYQYPARLVILTSDMEKRNVQDFPISDPDFMDLQRNLAGSVPDVAGVFSFTRTFPLEDGTA